MTTEAIEKVRKLVELGKKANPEDWAAFKGEYYSGPRLHFGTRSGGISLHPDTPYAHENALFIAAAANARNDIETLLDENDRLRAIALNQAKKMIDGLYVINTQISSEQAKAIQTLRCNLNTIVAYAETGKSSDPEAWLDSIAELAQESLTEIEVQK